MRSIVLALIWNVRLEINGKFFEDKAVRKRSVGENTICGNYVACGHPDLIILSLRMF